MFFMHKSEHEWQDKIIGQYDINMTYFTFIMSYRDFEHLAKVSQNQKSFNLGKYFYLNLPYLKNYLFWTNRTNSEVKTIWLPANAYFAILSQNPGWVENCFQLQLRFLKNTNSNPKFLHGLCQSSLDVFSQNLTAF